MSAPKYQQKLLKRKRDGDGEQDEKDGGAATHIPRATLTLKTYDPESGVVLKFKTDRAAEVGRLIHGLGRVGRHMAALPEKAEGSKRYITRRMLWLTLDHRHTDGGRASDTKSCRSSLQRERCNHWRPSTATERWRKQEEKEEQEMR